jgi:BirA family biotin operon repressor/biotin-[acetyl-CoA-carboxylase] ligase
VLLTAWAAVAVAETIRETTALQARIKWPNDLLLRGRKVCGILIEQGRGTVAGIGLNVNQTAQQFADAGLTEAASLASTAGRPFDRDGVARLLIERLDAEYDALLHGERSALESVWAWRIGLLGQPVTVETTDGAEHRGRLRDLGFDGVVLESSAGLVSLEPERVRQLYETRRG